MTLSRSDFPEAFNGRFSPAVTMCRCPKCKSTTLNLTETMEALTTFEVKDGLVNRQGGIHEFGSYVAVHADCNRCGHSWRVRNAIQITDVVTDLDPETLAPSALRTTEEQEGRKP